MSDDLISRKALMEKTKDYFISPDGALRLIESQPTAYDVDKVVKQLEENAKYFQGEADELSQKGDWGTATDLQGRATAYRDAAEIVKSGGVAND